MMVYNDLMPSFSNKGRTLSRIQIRTRILFFLQLSRIRIWGKNFGSSPLLHIIQYHFPFILDWISSGEYMIHLEYIMQPTYSELYVLHLLYQNLFSQNNIFNKRIVLITLYILQSAQLLLRTTTYVRKQALSITDSEIEDSIENLVKYRIFI